MEIQFNFKVNGTFSELFNEEMVNKMTLKLKEPFNNMGNNVHLDNVIDELSNPTYLNTYINKIEVKDQDGAIPYTILSLDYNKNFKISDQGNKIKDLGMALTYKTEPLQLAGTIAGGIVTVIYGERLITVDIFQLNRFGISATIVK